jgi:competence protein ComEA
MKPMVLMTAAALVAVLVSHAGHAQSAASASSQAAPAAKAAQTPVNVNLATAEQLEELPGIGRATAARIVEYRQKNGPFKKIEDLMNVRGIGEKSFLNLKPLITVGAAKPEKPASQP